MSPCWQRSVGEGSSTTASPNKETHYWAGTDRLGGTTRFMDSSFAEVDGMRYEPYGENRHSGANLKTDGKFTDPSGHSSDF